MKSSVFLDFHNSAASETRVTHPLITHPQISEKNPTAELLKTEQIFAASFFPETILCRASPQECAGRTEPNLVWNIGLSKALNKFVLDFRYVAPFRIKPL